MTKLSLAIAFWLLFAAAVASADDIFPPYTEFTLSNGLRTILIEDHRQPTVSISILFKTGASSDSPESAGRAVLAGHIMKENTRNFPGNELLEAIDSVGGIVEISAATKDGIYFEADFLARDISLALRIISDIVINPVFTQEALERMSRRLISINFQTRSVAQYRLMETLYREIYGECGYGKPALGTRTSLSSITLDDINDFFVNHIRPDNAILVVGGDINPPQIHKAVSGYFSGWKKGGNRPAVKYAPVVRDTLQIILIDNPAVPNADFMIGLPTAPVGSPDFPAMLTLNYIIGGGGRVSRMHRSLVEEKGLASIVTSELDWARSQGMLRIWGAAPAENATEAIVEAMNVLEELSALRLPQKELDETRYYFRGYAPMLYENVSSAVDQFVKFLSSGVDLPYQEGLLKEIELLTPLSLQNAAKKFLSRDKMTLAVIGSKAALLPSLSTLGKVTVIRLEEE